MNWAPLHCHSHFSLLDGLSKAEQITERLVECGYSACALTDHGTVAGVPSFVKACSTTCKCGHASKAHDDNGNGRCVRAGCSCAKFDKAELKAIAGCEFYICNDTAKNKDKSNGTLAHLCVLAKNQQGWTNLIKASSESNKPENFYRKPRLSLEELTSFAKDDWIVFSGHLGSQLANVVFDDYRKAFNCSSYEEVRKLVRKDWEVAVTNEIKRYQNLFGEANFFLEIQLVDKDNLPASLVVARILRYCGKKLGVPRVATADSHYPRRIDAADQRIILCSSMETTLKEVEQKLSNDEDVGLAAFFKSNNYHIPSLEEMQELHKDELEELANAVGIADRCSTPVVSNRPMLPVFPCPGGLQPEAYLKELCMKGWATKVTSRVPQSELETYKKRIREELEILNGAGLASYLLVVEDYIRFAREILKCLVGKGRGSSAGSLACYLLDITRLDPIKFKLLFSRFYNSSRNTKDRVKLPDIDTDFPIGFRDEVFAYLVKKYGQDKVCQMATFSRSQGRGALKDVLRANSRCDFEEMNRITAHIPDEAAISDKIQEMIEASGEASIIRWTLENNPAPLKEWCFINEAGELDGPLALDFAQAIRIEGTKRSQGKHASGVIISSVPLCDVVPMVYDKSSEQMIVGVDMRDAEEMGLVKFDLLSLRTLNCMMDAQKVIRMGYL